MEICDFRTCGLGGPTRADVIPEGMEETDFVDFLRNIGTPRDTIDGGGTYGFGKVAFYNVSKCSTLLVDSLVAGGEKAARRFVGCHVGSSYSLPQCGMLRRFTGRHWWGRLDSQGGIAEPILDDDAEQLASGLGFLPRGPGRSGTSIMILDFDRGGDNSELVGRRIVESLLWNFWPRMTEDTPAERRFTCFVEVDGTTIEIPRPEEFPPLDLFAKAMRAARNGKGNDVRKIASRRPKKIPGCSCNRKRPAHLEASAC